MDVIAWTWPDGTTSYQIQSATPTEMAALNAAPDPNTWIAANATVTATVPVPPPIVEEGTS